jgi:lipid A 3-O-deacylase
MIRATTLALSLTGLTLAMGPALATPAQDTASIVTLQVENDAVSTLRGTSDQYYTSGLRLGFTSGTNVLPDGVQHFFNQVWGDGVQRVSLDLNQSLFTPRNTQIFPSDPRDRPYAGVLALTGSIIHDTDVARTVLGLQLGVVGPLAQGKEVQNGFHNIIGDTPNKGWSGQLRNEPVFEIIPSRTWRLPIAEYNNIEFDALPSIQVGVGNLRDYVQPAFVVRFGQGLNSDFGVSRIQPGISGSDAYTPTRPFAWYFFAGADAQAVGRDLTIEGNTFRSSAGIAHKWYVGELEAGAALMLYGVRLTYSQTWQTQEFYHQKGGLFNFGSIAASVRF